jgi:hypothetical protein
MYYFVFSIHLVPGKRMAGIAHAKQLSTHLKEQYNIDSQVVGNETGAVYRLHLVQTYSNLAQMQDVSDKLLPGDYYQSWFAESMQSGVYDWSSAETHMYRVY